MDNANIMLIFIDVLLRNCDAESLPDNSGDACVYITESYTAFRQYVKDKLYKSDKLDAREVIKEVLDSVMTSLFYTEYSQGELTACNDFVSQLAKEYRENGYM